VCAEIPPCAGGQAPSELGVLVGLGFLFARSQSPEVCAEIGPIGVSHVFARICGPFDLIMVIGSFLHRNVGIGRAVGNSQLVAVPAWRGRGTFQRRNFFYGQNGQKVRFGLKSLMVLVALLAALCVVAQRCGVWDWVPKSAPPPGTQWKCGHPIRGYSPPTGAETLARIVIGCAILVPAWAMAPVIASSAKSVVAEWRWWLVGALHVALRLLIAIGVLALLALGVAFVWPELFVSVLP
jgi:hypothetical protein